MRDEADHLNRSKDTDKDPAGLKDIQGCILLVMMMVKVDLMNR